ncbi:hypothetical protein ACFWZ2_08810, partial [Streptomyces sp. NPDC059002]
MTGTSMEGCTLADGTYTCAAVEIPAGGTKTWTLKGTLDADATTTPTNTVKVTGGPDPSASERTAEASTTASPEPRAALEISKVLLTSPVVPGEQIQWRVTVKNNGPSRARNVVVRDAVPSDVSRARMRAESDDTDCPFTGTTAACPAVELAPGASVSYLLTGVLDPGVTTTPVNTATVTGGPDPSAATRTATASTSASPQGRASLTVTKVLLTSPVVAGQTIQWRVTVKNDGPSTARDIVVRDRIPASVTGSRKVADSDGTECPITDNEAVCPAFDLAVGATKTFTVTGVLSSEATTTPTNTVTVTGGPDPSASERTAVASPSESIAYRADLNLSKTLLTSPVVPGKQIRWRVTVKNNGPSRARDVQVNDPIPDGVSNPSMTADDDGTSCPIAEGVAKCPEVELAAGASKSYTLTATMDADATTTPTNTVFVTGGPDPSAGDNTATAVPTASPDLQAHLRLSKVLLTAPVVPGERIQWRVTVANDGPSRARNVVIKDRIPAQVVGATLTDDANNVPCPISSGTATCPAIDLAVNASRTFILTATLSPDATSAPENTATVSGGPDPSASTRTATASPSPATPRASLTVTKVLLTSPVVPGERIEW